MSFHKRSSPRRRKRSLTASTLVTGFPVSEIQHGNRRTILILARGQGENAMVQGDHPKRYAVGMRLAVKEMVPGPTALHVRVIDVQGKNERFTLGDVTRQTAKDLGQVRLDTFWRCWIINHDQDWFVENLTDEGVSDQAIADRFKNEWSGKLAWLIRFDIDHESAPRLLAAGGGGGGGFKAGADKRWVYAPRGTDREEDRGYTSSDALSLGGELPALTDDEWATHIGPKSPYRIADSLADRKAETWQARYATARAQARERRKNIVPECRRFDLLMAQGKVEKAMRQLDLIEARVFPVAA